MQSNISGYKWSDLNGNGIWDNNESTLAGWTIFIDENDNGELDNGEPSTITDANGEYTFTDLEAGTYKVAEVQQTGWQQIFPTLNNFQNAGFESGDFSEWNTLGVATIETATFGSGPIEGTYQALMTSGAGSEPDGNLEAFLNLVPGTLDSLGNGDATEGSALKRTLTVSAGDQLSFDWNFLTNEGSQSNFNDFAFFSVESSSDTIANTFTPLFASSTNFSSETGFDTFTYTFPNDGTFTVGIGVVDVADTVADSGVLVDNFSFTGATGGKHTVELDGEQDVSDLNFGNQELIPGEIRGYKWNDLNGDGIWDNNEPTLEGWTIFIDENDNGELDNGEPSEVTDANGEYAFTDLEAGNYTVAEVQQAGWQQTFPVENYTIELDIGETEEGINFGNQELIPGEIRGRKWNDLNGNSVWDNNEPTLEGWTIFLDENNNGELDNGEPSEVTDANGEYAFTDLEPRTYTVAEVQQPGWEQTYPSAGSSSSSSDGDISSNRTLRQRSQNDLSTEITEDSNNLNKIDSKAEVAEFAANQVIVKFKPGANSTEINTLQQTLGAEVLETTQTLGVQLWEISTDVESAVANLSDNPAIEYIEPNYTISIDATLPNDPDFNQLWGLNNTGQTGGTPDADIDAPEAWDLGTGNGNVVIGVIDTGVDYTHPDLAANMWTNPGEIPGDGLDNDGNGFVDDYYGYDFAYDDGDPFDGDAHGTHVSGTIAGVGDNGIGVTGVNWNAEIMAIKFLDDFGSGSTFNAVQAVEYATLMGADLTNNSWGGGGFSQALKDAIEAAGNSGQLFVAAAGNSSSNNDSFASYPASYDLDNIISVAATDHNDDLAGFSNYGATSVDLGAPGENIFSTVPGNGYASFSGTSMASPHVAGVAGLVLSRNSDLSPLDVKDVILNTVDPVSALDGITVTGGRLNAYNAVSAIAPPAHTVEVGSGEIVSDIDFGNWQPASISGYKWHDLDEDGEWDNDEPALPGWTIYIDANNNGDLDPAEVSTITDADGRYSFGDLAPETYIVAEVLQPGWTQTAPVDGNYTIDLAAGENLEEINFGNAALPGSLSGYKWNDLNGDGVWDNNEPALADWEIYLDHNQNGELDPDEPSTITDQNGNYIFSDLEAGTYTISEVLQAGWLQTFPTFSDGYLWSDSNDPNGPEFDWVDISTIGTELFLSDDNYAEVDLPFSFSFFGEEKNTVKISSNGYLSFGDSAFEYTNEPIPTALTPNDLIAPLWDDLNPSLGGSIYHYFDAAQEQFIVQYEDIPRYSDGGSLSFEVILDADGTILFQYDELDGTLNSATVGLENADGTDGVEVAFNETYLEDDLAVFLYPKTVGSHTVELGIGEDLSDFNFGNVDIGGAEALFFEDFADNDAGWTLDPEWEIGTATASSGERYGNPDPDTDHTPTDDNGVAGVVIGGNASQTVHDFYYLTSPVIDTDVSGDVFLEFQRWLNSDYQPYMSNTVEVFDGADWQVIWNTAAEPGILDDAWTEQQFDITAYKNTDLQVRFGFEVGSDRVFEVSSWNIDDFKIYTEEPTDTIMGETGIVTNLNHNSQTILLDQSYENPVVFAQPLSFNGGQPATVRITDVSSDSFTFYLQEPSNLDGSHVLESVSYIVLEEGVWELDNGTVIEVGSLESDATVKQAWESINFEGDFGNTPAVFSQVQTNNDPELVRTRQDDTTANGFNVALEEEEAAVHSPHGSETIGWFAMSAGSGTWDGYTYEVGDTGDSVTHNFYTQAFSAGFDQSPLWIASLGSYDGADPAGLRYQNLTSNSVEVKVEEDTTQDAETGHVTETVNYLAIEGDGLLSATAVNLPEDVRTEQPNANEVSEFILMSEPNTIGKPIPLSDLELLDPSQGGSSNGLELDPTQDLSSLMAAVEEPTFLG